MEETPLALNLVLYGQVQYSQRDTQASIFLVTKSPCWCSVATEEGSYDKLHETVCRLKKLLCIRILTRSICFPFLEPERKWSVSHSVMPNSLWPHGLFMGFPREEYLGGLPFPSPGNLPDLEIKPGSCYLVSRFFTIWASREAHVRKVLLYSPRTKIEKLLLVETGSESPAEAFTVGIAW